jgi:hypothetical protein
MAEKEPVAELEPPFSSDDATPWAARERLATAKVYWLSTIRHTDRVRPAGLYELAPTTAFGFGKGTFSQTRWRF